MKLSLLTLSTLGVLATAGKGGKSKNKKRHHKSIVTLGPRPYQLVDSMDPSFLKTRLGKFTHHVVVSDRVACSLMLIVQNTV
jgi:hypothetical protein